MEKISLFKGDVTKRLKSLKADKRISDKNYNLIKRFVEDCEAGKTLKHREKKRIHARRLCKYVGILKRIAIWFDKPLNTITKKDMDRVISNLDKDVYKKQLVIPIWKEGEVIKVKIRKTTKPISDLSKVDFKKAVKKFYKWLYGESKKYFNLTEDIETYARKKDPDSLTETEVEKLLDKCLTTQQRYIVAILFDSGARIEEFCNIRICDLEETGSQDQKIYRMNIRPEYVKEGSEPRNIRLVWKHSTKAIDNWLAEHPTPNKKDMPIITMSYPAIRIFLHRLGKKVLNKSVYPHLFRHSSSTFYAKLLKNRQLLCYRYGWKLSSDMPDRYIRRAGLEDYELEEEVKQKRLEAQQKMIERLQSQLEIYMETTNKSAEQIKELENKIGEKLREK